MTERKGNIILKLLIWVSLETLINGAVVPEVIPDIPINYSRFDVKNIPYKNDFSSNIFYQVGKSEEDLPACAPSAVCSKVDVYDTPWIQRQCRCPGETSCSDSLRSNDGFTITDKTRQFKMCEPTKKLRKCRYFRDITWSYLTFPQNVTQQIVHCVCPKNSVAYIVKRKMFYSAGELGYHYAFACSPQSRLRCQRKEPCRLFTVRKKERHQEVNTSTLCQCPHNHRCPKHHLDPGVIPGKAYIEDNIRTFSGYCM